MDPSPPSDHRALLHPGAPLVGVIDRPRLRERLDERFTRRLTLLVAGAGAGKTTLLAQVMASTGANVDIWHQCSAADRAPERLLSRCADACADVLDAHRRSQGVDPMESIRSALLAHTPGRACFVLDDVHLLDDAEPLERLVRELPANASVLLSGRSIPRIATTRLDALGRVTRIDERELLMNEVEVNDFARLRRVDASRLRGADGWPAFIEFAARGSPSAPRDFLAEEAVAGLETARRDALARFAAVGGGDAEIVEAVCGWELDELVAGLPLVRWTGARATLHDLWVDALDDVLAPSDRIAAVSAAADVLLERGDHEAAVTVAAQAGDLDLLALVVGAAIRDGVRGGLNAERVGRWAALLVANGRGDHPVGLLARGIRAREHDQGSADARRLLRAATDGFAEARDDEMALVAMLQLGYVIRVGGTPTETAAIRDEVAALAERHDDAARYLPFFDAWWALTTLDDVAQLEAVERLSMVELPPVWRATREHLRANALFKLGRADEALDAAPAADELVTAVPGAALTRAQCLWFSGRPLDAIKEAERAELIAATSRDRALLSVWSGALAAWRGDIATARRLQDEARRSLGSAPSALLQTQAAGVELVVDLAAGRDDTVAATLRSMIDASDPDPSHPVIQVLRTFVSIAYVVLPESRPFWDELEPSGPTIVRPRRIARALCESRDGDDRALATLDWSDPGRLAVALPIRWAVELALRGARAGISGAENLIRWLGEHWSVSTRDALHDLTSDERLGAAAAAALTSTPAPPTVSIAVQLLGSSTLLVDGAPSMKRNWRRERVRALLAWLVVHGGGSRRRMAEALWPDVDSERAARSLRSTLNYLHGLLEPDRDAGDATWFVRSDGLTLTLRHLDVDVLRFEASVDAAEAAERDGRVLDALPHWLEAAATYGGDLLPDLDFEWLDLVRIQLRSRYIRASARAAELLVACGRASEAVDLMTDALGVDPYHPQSHRALAAAYDELGDPTSARSVRQRAGELFGHDLTAT